MRLVLLFVAHTVLGFKSVGGMLTELAASEDGAGRCNWGRFHLSYAPDFIPEVVSRECRIAGIRWLMAWPDSEQTLKNPYNGTMPVKHLDVG